MTPPLPSRLSFSTYTALVGGILLPILETIRRKGEIRDPSRFLYWFDDYLIGGFLVAAAIRILKHRQNGQSMLSGAWGFAAGMGYTSFVFQLEHIGQQDPSGINSGVVVIIKGVMLLLSIACLFMTILTKEHQSK